MLIVSEVYTIILGQLGLKLAFWSKIGVGSQDEPKILGSDCCWRCGERHRTEPIIFDFPGLLGCFWTFPSVSFDVFCSYFDHLSYLNTFYLDLKQIYQIETNFEHKLEIFETWFFSK